MNILLYDTTLRDGTQREGISFSAEDKIKIARRLDQLGIAYVAGPAAEAALKDGRLRRILSAWTPDSEKIGVYYPGHRAVPPPLRAFLDVVKATRS